MEASYQNAKSFETLVSDEWSAPYPLYIHGVNEIAAPFRMSGNRSICALWNVTDLKHRIASGQLISKLMSNDMPTSRNPYDSYSFANLQTFVGHTSYFIIAD